MADHQLRTRIIRAFGAAIVVGALVGAGTALAASQSVAISGLSYSPASVTVNVGDSVTWTNSDAQAHTATADDASWGTGTITGSGGTGAVTFSTAGSFPYHCTIHPSMTGTVTVQAAAAAPTQAPAAGATNPPTDAALPSGVDGGANDDPLAMVLFLGATWAVAMGVIWRVRVKAR